MVDNQFSRPAANMPDNSQEWSNHEYNNYGSPQPAPQHQPEVYGGPVKRGGFFKYLLLILLIAAAAGGVYYWQHQKVADANKKVSDLNTQVDRLNNQNYSLSNQVAQQSSGSPDPANVVIKEMTLQLTVPGSLKDLTYKEMDVDYKKGTNGLGKSPTAFLSTTALDKLENGKCASTAFKADSNPPLGFLVKTTGQYPKAPTADNTTGTLVKQFTDFYVAYKAPTTGCFTDAKNNATAKKLSDQLVSILIPVTEKK